MWPLEARTETYKCNSSRANLVLILHLLMSTLSFATHPNWWLLPRGWVIFLNKALWLTTYGKNEYLMIHDQRRQWKITFIIHWTNFGEILSIGSLAPVPNEGDEGIIVDRQPKRIKAASVSFDEKLNYVSITKGPWLHNYEICCKKFWRRRFCHQIQPYYRSR